MQTCRHTYITENNRGQCNYTLCPLLTALQTCSPLCLWLRCHVPGTLHTSHISNYPLCLIILQLLLSASMVRTCHLLFYRDNELLTFRCSYGSCLQLLSLPFIDYFLETDIPSGSLQWKPGCKTYAHCTYTVLTLPY